MKWQKVNSEWYMCFHFDVIYHFGEWHLCSPYGQTFSTYKTPQAAMYAGERMDL